MGLVEIAVSHAFRDVTANALLVSFILAEVLFLSSNHPSASLAGWGRVESTGCSWGHGELILERSSPGFYGVLAVLFCCPPHIPAHFYG